MALGVEEVDSATVVDTLHVLLKYQSDIEKVSRDLDAGLMLLDVLGGFVQELRTAGIPVSMVEAIDAMEALRYTDLADRDDVQGGPRGHPGQERATL